MGIALVLLVSVSSHAQSMLDSFSSAFKFRSIGPAFMSGRIADIAVHPEDENTWYLALGSGGVWKTENAGISWNPIFEKQKVFSIGCITIDPHNPHRVWVGSGENVGGRHIGYGDGIYLSEDDGKSWKNMGLSKSEHISKIIVHPNDPNTIWVAAQGPLWSKGGERGLYKSTDGGKTWNNKLDINEWTGVTDLVIDPRDPDVLYLASWQRHRTVAAYMGGGPGTGLYKSEDGGETWTQLKKGLPGSNMGKIGLAISPMKPDVLYAAIELDRRTGAVYRSEDRGASWQKMSATVSGGTGPHYYQELYASPHQFDKIYLANVRMLVSEDGGKNFSTMNERYKHSDNHAVAWRADDPDYLLVGCDGGLYETFDGEKNWRFHSNLPTLQYYKVAVDDEKPFYNVYGGTQDNNTHGGPSRTDNRHGIRNADWYITKGGDGHQPATEPGNPNIVYSESQQGYLSRLDRSTGETVGIQPQPEEGEEYERYNWDAPILVSPHQATRLYYASQRIWRSDDRGESWRTISGDLTRNEERIELEIMGGKQSWDNAWDIYAMSNFNTITSLSESPVKEGLIYAGTDDGIIQITEDGGENWTKVMVQELPDCPERAFVNDIKADLFNENIVYVVLDHHKSGDYKPHIYRSSNKGKTWKKISSNLPNELLLWRFVQDPVQKDLFFLGTEHGVYASINAGKSWTRLKSGLPTIPVRDLVIQKDQRDLVCATFGRGFYILDDITPLREMSAEIWDKEAHVFQSRPAYWYIERTLLGWGKKASQGENLYVADNPQFGVNLTYYLKESVSTMKQERKEKEKAAIKAGKEYTFPGWDVLDAEKAELGPEMMLLIRDSEGNAVRYLKAAHTKGIHTINWDMRYPSMSAMTEEGSSQGRGFLCMPGTYSAQLVKRENGTLTALGDPAEFEVQRINAPDRAVNKGPEEADLSEVVAFWRELEQIDRRISTSRVVLSKCRERIDAVEKLLWRTADADSAMHARWAVLRSDIEQLQNRVSGASARQEVGEKTDPTIATRMSTVYRGVRISTHLPGPHRMRSFEIALKELEQVEANLSTIANERLPELEKDLQDAGSPYLEGMPYEVKGDG